MPNVERDHDTGHPGAADYEPGSQSAKDWMAAAKDRQAERDHPKRHPGAADSEESQRVWRVGEDPAHPEIEPFKGYERQQ